MEKGSGIPIPAAEQEHQLRRETPEMEEASVPGLGLCNAHKVLTSERIRNIRKDLESIQAWHIPPEGSSTELID